MDVHLLQLYQKQSNVEALWAPCTTAHPGSSDRVCYCGSVIINHTHTHTRGDSRVLLRTEVSDVSRMLQTSAAELGKRLGTSAGRSSVNLPNPPRGARQAPVSGSHASTLALHVTARVSVCVCVCGSVSLALPFPSRRCSVLSQEFSIPLKRSLQDAHPEQ